MATDILLAPVGAGEQLPGGCSDFDGNSTDGGWWGSSTNDYPDLGQKSWLAWWAMRNGGAPNGQYHWCIRLDNNNELKCFRFSSDSKIYFQLITSGTARVNCSILEADALFSCCEYFACWRNDSEWGICGYKCRGEVTPAIAKATATFAPGSTGDTLGTIKSNSSSRMYVGIRDGATGSTKLNGSIAGPFFWICGDGENLTDDYGIDTTSQLHLARILFDPQSMFSRHGFAASQCVAYGNWANSSGTLKTALTRTQIADSDRLVCPFTGKYLVFGATSHASQLMCPPYTVPATADPIQAWRGSGTYLDCPSVIENPRGGWLTYRTQKDNKNNPAFFVEFIGPDGEVNRWPHPVPFAYYFVDASASYAKGISWNGLEGTNSSHNGDTHTAMPLILTDAGLLCAPHLHSNSYADCPATGDAAFDYEQFVLLTDDATPETIETYTGAPWGTAFSQQASYTSGFKTYGLLTNGGGYTNQVSRSKSAAGAEVLLTEFKWSDKSILRKVIITTDGSAILRNYPGPLIKMSDGRRIVINHALKADSNTIIVYTAVICPPVSQFTDNTKYFSPTGLRLDGTQGLPVPSSLNQLSYSAIHITDDNAAFFASLPLPSGSVGMDFLRMETPCHVTGEWEGIAAIVRKSTANGDLSTVTNNSSGITDNAPFDETTLRRWTYTGGSAPTLVLRDSFDITSIIATLNPGTWPQDTSFDTSEVQYLHAARFGVNKKIVYIVDPENVAIGTDKGWFAHLCGFTVRAVIFHDLAADDPTEYIEYVDDVFSLATDNSEGYGCMPYFAGSGNDGSRSVMLHIMGGDWVSQGWGNRIAKAVDMRPGMRTIYHANGLLKNQDLQVGDYA